MNKGEGSLREGSIDVSNKRMKESQNRVYGGGIIWE